MAKKNTQNGPVITKSVVTLATIVAAGANGMYTAPEVHNPLVADGLVEVNTQMKNENGEFATRATQKGIDSMNSNTSATTGEAAIIPTTAAGFKIDAAVPVPSIVGRGRAAGGSVYPFEQLEAGQSFFVPNSEKMPNAAKSLASTVSSATARYAAETGETKETKVPVYQTNADGKRVKGADGKLVKTGEKVESRKVMTNTREFTVRSVTEGGVTGARIWRTK